MFGVNLSKSGFRDFCGGLISKLLFNVKEKYNNEHVQTHGSRLEFEAW